jgi:hypothetical protein
MGVNVMNAQQQNRKSHYLWLYPGLLFAQILFVLKALGMYAEMLNTGM